MHIPSSTYRVQLHQGFTFKDLHNIIDYLKDLGISTIYASPILSATPGSMHGYDVTDPHTINPEIGTLDELRMLSKKLKERNMFWIQDIVPNHMAFNTRNTRLMDVLERGPSSPYYHYFDINWNHPSPVLNGKVCVPFLGKEIAQCVDDGEIRLSFSENGFAINYFETQYPLSVSALPILQSMTDDEELKNKLALLAEGASTTKKSDDWHQFKSDWATKIQLQQIDRLLTIANDPSKLLTLLEKQYYALTFWQAADKEINYRRFFTVNELICLRMEDDAVFEEYHKLVHALYNDGIVQGIRIDHIDGLRTPGAYIQKLREKFGDDIYIIAEKILEAKEDLPADWRLEGTSGYEFLAHVNQLTTDRKGARQLLRFYRELVPQQTPYKDLVLRNKKLILERHMNGEWDNLVNYFIELGLQHTFETGQLRKAIAALMVSIPVYRIYPSELPLRGKERMIIKEAFEKALSIQPGATNELTYLSTLFFEEASNANNNALQFLMRFMQFTGPLTAKGVEDTTFYLYNPLISHDEVGDAPATLGISIQEFHRKMNNRLSTSARSLNASATHDTKRGEDARVRLNVLCELADQWESLVRQWMDVNTIHRADEKDRRIPNINDEYLIYQGIVGGFPENLIVNDEWIDHLKAYLTKAFREAKQNSNWTAPDEKYEAGCLLFVTNILTPGSAFLNTFHPFIKDVCDRASLHSLTQVTLKCMAPGIPDIYQGCELLDLSFVDPDNRRPVDYEKRKTCLQLIQEHDKTTSEDLFDFLESSRTEGFEKMFVTWKLLQLRKDHNNIFIHGSYTPLQTAGSDNKVIAFVRQYKDEWVLVAIDMITARTPYSPTDYILLPEDAPAAWKDVLWNRHVNPSANRIALNELFTASHVCVLKSFKQ